MSPALVFILTVFQTFTGIIARIREPEATVTIFQSGKIISLGTKRFVWSHISSDCDAARWVSNHLLCFLFLLISVEESRLAARKFARKLQKFGFPVRFLNFKIQNIVAFCQTFPVDLAELQKVHRGQCRSGDKDSEWRLGPNRDAGLKPNFDHITCQSTLLCAK